MSRYWRKIKRFLRYRNDRSMGCICSKGDVKIPFETGGVLPNEMPVQKETEPSAIMMHKLSEDHSHHLTANFKTIQCPNTGVIPLRAAVLIQCWYRRQVANLEVRRRCAWKVLQALEYKTTETNFLELRKMTLNFL